MNQINKTKIKQFIQRVAQNIGQFTNVKKLSKGSKPSHNSGRITYFIFFLAFSAVVFFGVKRYFDFIDYKIAQYQNISSHIASEYEGVLNYSQLLLNSVNQEILKSKSFGTEAVKILSSINRIRNQNNVANQIFYESMLYWIDSNKYLIASSAGRVLKPIDLSSRDYLEKTQIDPWKIKVGKVIIGALSGNNVLPVAVGVVGDNGYHLGTAVISIKLENLIDKFTLSIHDIEVGEYAIIDADGAIILESRHKSFSKNKMLLNNVSNYKFVNNYALIKPFNILRRSGNVVVASKVLEYPFTVIYKVNNYKIYQELFMEILPYLVQILFLLMLLASYMSKSRPNYRGNNNAFKKYY